MHTPTIYIAGPMRGIVYFNFPTFDAASRLLRQLGWHVISPADLDREAGFDPMTLPESRDWHKIDDLNFDLRGALERDCAAICRCDAIMMLPGSHRSKGARAELALATALGLRVFAPFEPIPCAAAMKFPPRREEPTPAAAAADNPRKSYPLATGCLDYFPDALTAVSHLSKVGNDQHNPGQPPHWNRQKSTDHADCLLRHLRDRGTVDADGVRHSTKVAWRALANLQLELETAGA